MDIDATQQAFEQKIAATASAEALAEIAHELFGRKQGLITTAMREIPKVAPEKRGAHGAAVNGLKKALEAALEAKKAELESSSTSDEYFDFSAPAKPFAPPALPGRVHPISGFIEEAIEVFGRLGFAVASGPEVDTEEYNFNALNIPADHPAREMQDTFWLPERRVLRTQTSNMQIHAMRAGKPPFRFISPGKVFRKDSDATHSPMFHQIEGVLIDKNVSVANLKWTLENALRELVSPTIELRFRTSFFPFTEPSLEVDARLGESWLEIGGAGMTHPNVLANVGVDPSEWNGFAFGFGVERMVMIQRGITDLRAFFEGDLRFLRAA